MYRLYTTQTSFFDYQLSGTNGDTIYISSIVIAAYDVASSNDLTKLHSFPGPIDYGKTASVQKQGTLWNGVSFSPTEGSFNLDGSNDYIEVGSEPSLNFGTGDFTALCWVGGLTAHPGSAKSIIWKGSRFDGNVAGWSITWAGSPQDLYFIISSDSARLEGRTVPNSGLNGWQGYKMIGLQRSGSSWRQINGTTVTQLGTFTGNVDSTNSVFIGRNGHYNTYLSNLVNKVLIYNRALSQTEINQNYYLGRIITDSLVVMLDAANQVSYNKETNSWYNLSGVLYNGTFQNSPTYSNVNNGVIDFDGTSAWVQISTYNFGNGNWTCNAWVQGDVVGYSSTGNIVSNSSGGPVTSAMGFVSSKIHYRNYDGAWKSNSGNTTLSAGRWYMLTWVNYAGATAGGGTMKMFVDGLADSSVFNSYTINGGPCDAIGRNWFSYFNGKIGVVQFYNKSLSDSEVTQNFSAYRSRYAI